MLELRLGLVPLAISVGQIGFTEPSTFIITLNANAILKVFVELLVREFFTVGPKLVNFEDYLVFKFDLIMKSKIFCTLHFG